jgi:hypothetical protein
MADKSMTLNQSREYKRRKSVRDKYKDALDDIESRRKSCRESRRGDMGRWQQAVAFYEGRQWVQWNENKRKLEDFVRTNKRGVSKKRVRITVNAITPAVRQVTGLLLRNRGAWQTMPAQPEEGDRDKQRAGQEILEWYTTDARIPLHDLLTDWVAWGVVCGGGGILKATWDEKLKYYDGGQGDIAFELVEPFRAYWDITRPSIQDSSWFIEELLMPVERAKKIWPGKDEMLVADGHTARDGDKGLYPYNTGAGTGSQDGEKDLLKGKVIIRIQWEKPTLELPKGRMTYATRIGILEVGDMLPTYMFYPYFRFVYLRKLDNGASGIAPGEMAVEPQMLFNRLMSQMTENNNALLYYYWLLHTDANVSVKQIQNATGRAIYWDGDHKPEIITAPAIAHQIWQQMSELKRSMQDIFALHDPMTGVAPGSIESGKAIEALQEQDLSAQAPAMRTMTRALMQLGQHILHLVREKWTTKRLIYIMGKTFEWEAKKYKGSDIGKNVDVRLAPSSDMPETRSGRRQFMLEMAQYKLPEMMQQSPWFYQFLMRNLKVGATGAEFYQEQRMHENAAKRESESIINGDDDAWMMEPNKGPNAPVTLFLKAHSWDDHQVHIMQHTRDILEATSSVKSKIGYDVKSKVLFAMELHIQTHKGFMVPTEQMQALFQSEAVRRGSLERFGAGESPAGQGTARGAGQATMPTQPMMSANMPVSEGSADMMGSGASPAPPTP